MKCDIFTYRGKFYTADNLYRVLGEPGSHEEVFWQLNKDTLETVKTLKEDITGFYKDIFDGNEKQVLYEAAVQANSSESEKSGATKVFGPRIIELAQSTFPNAQVGGTYEAEIARTINKRFPTPERDETVNFRLRLVDALSNPKVQSLFNRFYRKDPDKFYFELNIYAGKQQVQLLRDWNNANNPNSLEEMAAGILANMSQVVTVTTSIDPDFLDDTEYSMGYREDEDGKRIWQVRHWTLPEEENVIGEFDNLEDAQALIKTKVKIPNSSHYSNLTVPGGTNYQENEIATPGITPVIKGHAAFSTPNGIGWFRSDDMLSSQEEKHREQEMLENTHYEEGTGEDDWGMKITTSSEDLRTIKNRPTKTRRILEVQSDLFQKGRDKEDLTEGTRLYHGHEQLSSQEVVDFIKTIDNPKTIEVIDGNLVEKSIDKDTLKASDITKNPSIYNHISNSTGGTLYYKPSEDGNTALHYIHLNNPLEIKYQSNPQGNQFLQLLNKDNNWVTFFIKSIIQDSAKKEYEKVWFPAGNTAAKIEGHQTLEGFLTNAHARRRAAEERRLRAETTIERRLESIKRRIDRLQEEIGEAKKQKVTSGDQDWYIDPQLTGTKHHFSRIRRNLDGGSKRGLDLKLDLAKDPTYTGWIIQNYTVGKENEIIKITEQEAQELLDRNNQHLINRVKEDIEASNREYKDLEENFGFAVRQEEQDAEREEEQVRLEIEQAQTGTLKISSIANFYEKDVFNILKKKGFNPTRVTDEHGNDWYEVSINQVRDIAPISLNVKSWEQQIIEKLQLHEIIGSRKFRNEYWVKKTSSIDPPDRYQPEETVRRNLEKIKNFNKHMGYEVVKVLKRGDSYIIRINPQPTLPNILNQLETYHEPELYRSDQVSGLDAVLEYLFNRSKNPITTDVINNVARIANDMGRQDLVELARFIHMYLQKNPSLRVIAATTDEEIEQAHRGSRKAPGAEKFGKSAAAYIPINNTILFDVRELLRGGGEWSIETVLHEFIHSISAMAINGFDESKAAGDFVNELQSIFDSYKRTVSAELQKEYAFFNLHEFLAIYLTDEMFRDRVERSRKKGTKSLWKRILEAIYRLLGIPIIKEINADTRNTLMDHLSDYLHSIGKLPTFHANVLNEAGRDYDINFQVVPASKVEKEKKNMREQISDDYREEFKRRVRKLMDGLSSLSNSKTFIDADDNFFYLFREAKKFNQNIIDEVDYFFSFINELSAVTNLAVNKIRNVRDNKNMSREAKIVELFRINNTIQQYGIIINELRSMKEKVVVGTPLESVLNNIIVNADAVSSVYKNTIKPLVAGRIAELASPATQRAIEDQQNEIKRLNGLKAIAERKKDKKAADNIQNKINEIQKFIEDKLEITEEKADDALSGLLGDSHMLTAWMEPMIVNPAIAPAAVAKVTTDAYNSIAPLVNQSNNDFQSAMDEYSKATDRSTNNIEEFNAPFIETVDIFDDHGEDGKPTYKKKLALLSPYNLKYIQDLREIAYRRSDIEYKIRHAKDQEEKNEWVAKLDALVKEKRQLMKDYFERPYIDAVHDAMDLLDEDLGGFTVREHTAGLYDERDRLEKELEAAEDASEAEIDRILEEIDKVDFLIKRLRYDENKDPESKEYKVAQQLKKYDAAMKPHRTFEVTPRSLKKFNAERRRVDDNFAAGLITEKQRDRWYQMNTVTEWTDEYWQKRREILNELEALRERLGIATPEGREDMNKLYARMESIVKVYRDNRNIINGLKVPAEEVKLVRDIEVQIDQMRSELADIYGLTKDDKIALREIYARRDQLEMDIMYGGVDAARANFEIGLLDEEAAQILSKRNDLKRRDVDAYYTVIKKLSDLTATTETEYYETAVNDQIDKLMAQVDVSNITGVFVEDDWTYTPFRTGSEVIWTRIPGIGQNRDASKQEVVDKTVVENAWRKVQAKVMLRETDWWKENHITKYKYIKDGMYEIDEPIYIWKHSQPKLPGYISTGQPSLKYKRAVYKKEAINPNYRDETTGYGVPKLYGAKDDRYVNKKYRALQHSTDPKDKATFKALQFLTDKYLDSQHSIPNKKYRPGYLLPSILKTQTERTLAMTPNSVVESVKGVFKGLREDLTKMEQDKDVLFGYNEVMSTLPVKYIGPIENIDDQSRDVFRSILMFNTEIIKRKQLMNALPFAMAVRNILQAEENKPVKIDSKGKISTFAKRLPGNKFIAKLIPGESQSSRQVTEYIRSYYFGETIKDEPGAKQVNWLLGVGAKLLLGMNYAASTVNYMNAATQSLIESEVRRGAFTWKQNFEANAIYAKNLKEYVADIGKVGNKSLLTQMFDYFGGNNFEIISKQTKTLAYSKLTETTAKFLIPNEMAEHAIGNQLFIAMALNEPVKQGDRMIRLIDAFELKGGNLTLKPGVELSYEQRMSFISRMNAAARRINGNYNALNKVQVQKYMLGRCLLFMNNYFTPFLMRRFGNKRFSIEDGVTDEGYWRTFFKTTFKGILSHNSIVAGGWKYYTEAEKAATIRTMTEMSASFLAMGLIMALGGEEPEDLKENGLLANNLIYILKMYRRQNEQFMIVPGLGLDDIYQKLKSPFPIMGKLGNLFSLMNRVIYHLGFDVFGVGEEKDTRYTRSSGWHEKGDLKIFTDFSRLTGFLYRFNQMQHPDVAIQNMDAYRIK